MTSFIVRVLSVHVLAVRVFVVFVVGITVLVARPTAASAGTVDRLATWLDARPAVAVRVDLAELEAGARVYAKSSGNAARQLLLVAAAGTGLLGSDLLTKAGWQRAGFDSSAPIMATIGYGNHADVRRFVRDRRQPGGTTRSPPYTRNRAVLRIANRARVVATVYKLAKFVPALHKVNAANVRAIAGLLNADATARRSLLTQLRRAGVLVVGRLGGGTVFVHRKRDVLVVDQLRPFGPAMRWRRDRRRVLRLIRRRPRSGGLATRLTRGAATLLRKPGLAVWINPTQLLNIAAIDRLDNARTRSVKTYCSTFETLARRGAFVDVTVHAQIQPKAIVAAVHWGLAQNTPHGLGWKHHNAALVDTATLRGGNSGSAVAVGALLVSNLDALTRLSHPTSMRHFDVSVFSKASACGFESSLVLALFGWPHVGGTMISDIAKLLPRAGPVFGGLGNVAVRAERVSFDRLGLRGAFGVSMNKSSTTTVHRLNNLLFGHKRHHGGLTRWSRGPLQVFSFASAGTTVVGAGYATTVRAASDSVVTFHRTSPKLVGQHGSALARFRLNLPVLTKQLASTSPSLRPIAAIVNAVAGEMHGRLVAAKRRLDLRFTISLK